MTCSSTRRPVVSDTARRRRFAVCLCLCLSALLAYCPAAATSRAQTPNPAAKKAASKSAAPLAPIKDFVNKDTLAVARVNLDKIDVDQLGQTLASTFKQALSLFEFAPESENACLQEFRKSVEALQKDVTLAQKSFRDEYGVSEAFVVIQTPQGDGACLIVPIQGVSETQLDALKNFVKENLKLTAAVYQKKFLLASKIPLKELGAFYQKFQPSANKVLEDFFRQHNDKFIVAYSDRLKIRPLLHATSPTDEAAKAGRIRQYDPFANSPQSVKTLVEVFDSSFVGGYAYVDVSNLNCCCALTFTTPVNAGQFRDALSDAIEAFNNFYFKLLETSETGAKTSQFAPGASLARRTKASAARYHMYQWTRDVWTGRMRRYLPVQDKETLVLNLSVQDELQKLGVNSIAVWLYTKNTDLVSPVLLNNARGLDAEVKQDAQSPFMLTTRAHKRAGELTANPFEANIVEETPTERETNDDDGANPFDENVVEGEDQSEPSKPTQETSSSESSNDETNAASGENPFDAGVEVDEPSAEGNGENPFDAGVEEDEPDAGTDGENPFDAGLEEDDK